uniref:Uncharacterized protein n=1 Tax=Ananas comosus var. bracteatus TaxID=296719 RepID=A0A6V7QY31_ANACO
METPSSTRRVTRSQTSASTAASSQKSKQHEDLHSRPRKNGGGANADWAPLLDITNDSPIVGLAAVEKTPSSSSSSLKSRVRVRRTPGSGEAILRGQVKTLLQKVEEEGDFAYKPSSILQIPRFPTLAGISRSPAQLLAPTPANTPQIASVSTFKEECPTVTISQQVVSSRNQAEPQECVLNRALLFDSPSKSGASEGSAISSSLTFQGSESSGCCTEKLSTDDDSSSLWSIQANASAHEEDYEGEADELFEGYGEEEDEAYFDENEDGEGEDPFADLCEGMRKMSVVDEAVGLPEFKGKHTRFVYNSDGEIEGEEEAVKGEEMVAAVSPGVLVLKGLPVPEGKHLRFHEEDDES